MPLLPKCQVTKVSKKLQEFHFYVRKCHVLVRKVPILLTHLKERERERENKGKRELVPGPVKIMKGSFVLGKKNRLESPTVNQLYINQVFLLRAAMHGWFKFNKNKR